MKIVHILLGKANPERMNGVNKIAHQMATTQTELGHDVTIIGITSTLSDTGQRPYKLKLIQANPQRFSITTELKEFIIGFPKEAIFHFHGVLTPTFYSISKFLRKNGFSYVVTPHGSLQPLSMHKNQFIKQVYTWLFEKTFLKNASKIQAITKYEQDCLQKLTETPVILIPNAYPYPPLEELTPPNNKEIIFGFIGRLDANHKGLDILIDGFTEFYNQHKQGYLWLIGQGPNRNRLENQSTLKDRILFKGEFHNKDKHDLLCQVDVFVHPSRWDVLPTSILEAAAYQRPLIVTKETGFAEAVTKYHAGSVLESNNAYDLSQAMEVAYFQHRDQSLQNIGKNAENMVKQEFNWANVIHNVISDLYHIGL